MKLKWILQIPSTMIRLIQYGDSNDKKAGRVGLFLFILLAYLWIDTFIVGSLVVRLVKLVITIVLTIYALSVYKKIVKYL